MQPWRYSQSIGTTRINNLASPRSLPEILDDILRDAEVLCVHRRDCDDIAGFSRVMATVRVPRDVFDSFFNSQHGYRGAYAASPYAGLEANDQILDRLTPFVLGHSVFGASKIDPLFAKESLSSPSAKVWLAEVGLHLCSLCEGEWAKPVDSTPDVLNGVWEPSSCVEAAWGCKAPYLTKLKVIGAFLSARYDEYVPFHKRRRAELIHWRGWA